MKEKEKRGGKKPYRNLRVIKFQSYVIHSEYIFIGTFETLRGNSSLGISHNRHAYINRAHISHLTISTQQEKERERERPAHFQLLEISLRFAIELLLSSLLIVLYTTERGP